MITSDIGRAAAVLREGGLVAYPTESMYGVGCDPRDDSAVLRLMALKGRDAEKGFILLASSRDQLRGWIAEPDETVRMRLDSTWPGPMTWVLDAAAGVSALITGGRGTVAARVTAHPDAAELCRAAGRAIVSTSANRSGSEPLVEAGSVLADLGEGLDCILAGPVGDLAGPTEIRDARSGEVLRPPPRVRDD